MSRTADPRVAHIINGYSDAVRALRDRVTGFVSTTWHGLDAYRDPDIDTFAARVVPVVHGAQRQVASLTDSYFAALETNVRGTPPAPVGIPDELVTTKALRGVDALDVYRRPGVTVWNALANGVSLDDAVQRGATRALSLATTDLQLARTHTAQYVLSRNDNVAGYRRVPNGADVCALCAVASTQRYTREDLMPIHPGCSCDVEPIYGDSDPGQVIDPDQLEGIHQQIEDRLGYRTNDAAELRDLVLVHEHGEIGPVLAVRGQHFTGPDDL